MTHSKIEKIYLFIILLFFFIILIANYRYSYLSDKYEALQTVCSIELPTCEVIEQPTCDATLLIDEIKTMQQEINTLSNKNKDLELKRQYWEDEYYFMRSSFMQQYDITTFPMLIDGLYFNKTIHVQVNDDVSQGLDDLCHEATHYFIEEDYKHFCG